MLITPETRIGPLLDAHPELEAGLIARVPAFAKLQNPLLRRTVAKVATLEHAARVAGVPLLDLLNHLRAQLGQELTNTEAAGSAQAGQAQAGPPPWFQAERVVLELDATLLLATGEHPVGRIRQALASHPAGAIVLLTSGFEPAPLLALFQGEGAQAGCWQEAERFLTCLRRP